MVLIALIAGCVGFFLAGSAFTRFEQTRKKGLLAVSVIEIFTGMYFVMAAIGAASL